MREDLLHQVATFVDSFHLRPLYDYDNARSRLIFEGLTQGVQYVYNNPVDGDIAEFGTNTGFSAFTIAKAMAAYDYIFGARLQEYGSKPKLFYLFDSFQGLPRADNAIDAESPNVRAGRWAGQRRAWQQAVEKYRISFSDCGDYAVLSHKFIVHMD